MTRKNLFPRVPRVAVVCALAGLAVAGLRAQTVPTLSAINQDWPETIKVDGIEILPVLKNVYMLAGGGANVTIQIGDEGVVMVDTGAAGQSAKLQAAVRRLTRKPLRYLIDSGPDPDHVGGNGEMVKFAGGTNGPQAGGGGGGGRPPNVGTAVIAHENAYNRMINGSRELPALTGDSLPESTFFTPRKDLFANGEPVQLLFQPAAHTDGDIMVFFRGSDVVAAGDIFRTDRYPMIDLMRGGSINGELAALNNLLDITVPERNQMGGTRVVPGHGRIGNESDVLEYRDMLTIIRDRVKVMIDRGQTLAQVRAAKPALEYDGLYGKDRDWTGDMFLEAVYNSLKK
jgi:glyoxylase-like metal-dependent hydrolase (beta-lactamase superfamily II)